MRCLPVLAALAFVLAAACDDGTSAGAPDCRVESVVDGDTVYVDCLEERVRLLLIDTPEMAGNGAQGECYGAEAAAYVDERLPRGTAVRLESGRRDNDQYGRPLRYVFIGDELLNETLVREGYARRYRDAEDRTYEDRIIAAEEAARREGRGLWSACGVE